MVDIKKDPIARVSFWYGGRDAKRYNCERIVGPVLITEILLQLEHMFSKEVAGEHYVGVGALVLFLFLHALKEFEEQWLQLQPQPKLTKQTSSRIANE